MARGKSGKAGLPAPGQVAAVVVMMTPQEAEEVCGRIDRNMVEARNLLLELHDREGWKALGFASWRECVVARFAQHQSYLYRQLQAGQLEQELDLPIGTLPESHARALVKVPAEKRAEVLEAVSPNGEKPTAKAIAEVAATVCKFRVDDVVLTPEGKRAVVTAMLKGRVRVDDGGDALTEHPIDDLALIRHHAIFGAGERVVHFGQGNPRHGTVQTVHTHNGVAVVVFDDGGSAGCDLWRLDPEPEPEGLPVPQVGDWVRLPGRDELHEVKGLGAEQVYLLMGDGAVVPWPLDEIAGVYKQNSLLEPDELDEEAEYERMMAAPLTDDERVIVEQHLAGLKDAPELLILDQVHPGDLVRLVDGREFQVLKAGHRYLVLEGGGSPIEVQEVTAVQREGKWHPFACVDRPLKFEAVIEDVDLKITISREIWDLLNRLPNPRATMGLLLERSLKKAFEAGELG